MQITQQPNPQRSEKNGDKPLPDVARENSLEVFVPLNWVGMEEISLPVLVDIEGRLTAVPAKVDAQVSLDLSSSRGIHMSRLYNLVQSHFAENNLSVAGLITVTDAFLRSHADLSSASRIRVRMDLPVKRKALKSQNFAWRTYPVSWMVENRKGQTRFWFELEIAYSSTCPASAALSRQLIQENFKANFVSEELNFADVHHWLGTTEGILATPHAQRSYARIGVEMSEAFQPLELINLIEDTLQTAVQTIVKREDEQEFALRNGQNLMFCEDAIRRIQKSLATMPAVSDFAITVNHQESLHPHNAVSSTTKNLQSRLKGLW